MHLMIFGVFGKIASGKSTFAAEKSRDEPWRTWRIMEADLIGHDLLRSPGVRREVLRVFSEYDISSGEEIDRDKLRSLVFMDYRLLDILESILHPFIEAEFIKAASEARTRKENLLFVCPLPRKIGILSLCDSFVVLPISKKNAWERVKSTRAITKDIFVRIWARQDKEILP